MKCVNCGNEVNEVCGDGFCRDCHVSLSFEDCVSVSTYENCVYDRWYNRK